MIYRNDLLSGKVALVTGAGKGIGRESAKMLALAGANVFAVARTESDLESLKVLCPENIKPWVADATSSAFFHEIEEMANLDILVNNIGTNDPKSIQDMPVTSLDHMLNLNVRSVYLASQAAVRTMSRLDRPGCIINISSQMGHVGSPNRTAYCMTKHAIEGLTKAMAVELAEQGIRVNSVAPTFINTPLTEPMFEDPEFRRFVLDKIPMRKVGDPVDVANAVVYLASEASRLITGTSLKVDGGWTAH